MALFDHLKDQEIASEGTSELVRQAMDDERARSEILVGWVQMLLVAAFALIYFISPKAFAPDATFIPVPWVLGAYFVFTVARLSISHWIRLPNWFVILSIAVDIALLFALIWSFHVQYLQPAAFYLKAPEFVFVFVFIALRALRFEPRPLVIAGMLAASGWLFMVGYAIHADVSGGVSGSARTSDYAVYLTSNSILVGAEIGKLTAILAVTMILALAVSRARDLVARQVSTARDNANLATALAASQDRYKLVTEGSKDGIFDINLQSGERYFSPRAHEMLAAADGVLAEADARFLPFLVPEDDFALTRAFEEAVNARQPVFACEVRIRTVDGRLIWGEFRAAIVYDADGEPARVVGSLGDITERKKYEEQLLRDALRDRLTGLPNRTLLVERVRQLRQRGRPFVVLSMDIDKFKTINDSLGHATGDEMLVAVARRLERIAGPDDTVARLGGDEFVILAERPNAIEAAESIVASVRTALAQPMALYGQIVSCAASIGVVVPLEPDLSAEDILRDADLAMYRAKNEGRGSHAVFEKTLRAAAHARLRIESELRGALDRNDFSLVYQPIVEVVSRDLVGFEALLRWNHPEKGVVSPADFIPIAEETGLIVPIGAWVIETASRQLGEWVSENNGLPLFVTVNVSARQFERGANLVETVAAAIRSTGLAPSRLKLEVTESLAAQNPETAGAMLEELSRLGVTLAIDDFGTGYSSLNQLHRLPFDTLKIDRSFVSRIGQDVEGSDIVDAIVDIARRLGMDVVAEGVETDAQRAYLASINCAFAQGYLFARPLSVGDASRLVRDVKAA